MKIISLSTLFFLTILLYFSSCKKEEADPLTELSITSKDTIFLEKGQSKKVDYHYNPSGGVEPDLAWKTSDKNIVSVDKDGTLHANNTGKATITLWVNDGTGLESTKTVYVFETPQISITGVSDVTYYSANFSLNYNLGGGDESNTTIGFVWDTVAQANLTKNSGIFKIQPFAEQCNVDMFDPDGKIYVRGYIKTPLDTVYTESKILNILPVPEGILGNYMLNLPLANGRVAKCGDYIVFASKNDFEKLYKIKSDLTSKVKLNNTMINVKSLNVIGNNIYFSAKYEPNGLVVISRIKTNGSGLYYYRNDSRTISTWGAFVLDGNYIYPTGNVFRISLNNKEINTKYYPSIYLNIHNNFIYYRSAIDSLCAINKINLAGSFSQKIYEGYHIYRVGIYGNTVFFTERGTLRNFDLNSPDVVQTLPIKPTSYNIANYSIFYCNTQDENKLYKCDLSGNLVTKMSDDAVEEISIIDDWLYYYSGNNLYRIKQDGTGRQLVD